MDLVTFVVEEKGKETSGTALRVDRNAGPDAFTRAVDELAARNELSDPETRQMLAGHFAEVALSKVLAGDEATAARAANALLMVVEKPYVLVHANVLRGDLEITGITPIEAAGIEEAEAVFEASLERILSGQPEH